jgi:hypothetical protein
MTTICVPDRIFCMLYLVMNTSHTGAMFNKTTGELSMADVIKLTVYNYQHATTKEKLAHWQCELNAILDAGGPCNAGQVMDVESCVHYIARLSADLYEQSARSAPSAAPKPARKRTAKKVKPFTGDVAAWCRSLASI